MQETEQFGFTPRSLILRDSRAVKRSLHKEKN